MAKQELDDFERKEREFRIQDREEKADWLEAIATKYLEKKASESR